MTKTTNHPEFHLAPELRRDTFVLGELALCRVLLMNDQRFPWVILVPRRAGAVEMFALSEDDQQQLMREITVVARALQACFKPTKINIGALGNIVRQLHVHVIARFEDDAAWPGPVWGAGKAAAYPNAPDAPDAPDAIGQKIMAALLAGLGPD